LLNIPGFIQSFEKGKQDIANGEITSCEKLKRKYRNDQRLLTGNDELL
jgi:hypothetical protein